MADHHHSDEESYDDISDEGNISDAEIVNPEEEQNGQEEEEQNGQEGHNEEGRMRPEELIEMAYGEKREDANEIDGSRMKDKQGGPRITGGGEFKGIDRDNDEAVDDYKKMLKTSVTPVEKSGKAPVDKEKPAWAQKTRKIDLNKLETEKKKPDEEERQAPAWANKLKPSKNLADLESTKKPKESAAPAWAQKSKKTFHDPELSKTKSQATNGSAAWNKGSLKSTGNKLEKFEDSKSGAAADKPTDFYKNVQLKKTENSARDSEEADEEAARSPSPVIVEDGDSPPTQSPEPQEEAEEDAAVENDVADRRAARRARRKEAEAN